MSYRALAYRSRAVHFISLNVRAVGPMASFRRVIIPHRSHLLLQLNGRNAPLAASPFSTITSHGRGNLNMEEAEDIYGLDSMDEAQFSEFRTDEGGEPAEPTTHSEETKKKKYKGKRKRSDSSNSRGIDPSGDTKKEKYKAKWKRSDPSNSKGIDPSGDTKQEKYKAKWKGSDSSNSGGIDPNDTTVYPTTSELAHKIMRKTWGFDEFRQRQEEVISRLIHGGSAVVVFPTGGGKSLVFQIPALALDEYDESMGRKKGGISIVVSPLVALMKDQVEALQKRGVKAAAIDSTQTRESVLNTYDLLRKGELKLLYCAPERLNNEGFVETIRHTRVRLIAVDEAHCISEWGQAFRPDYLKVARFVKEMNAERVLCLTATATPKVCKDILEGFHVPESGLFKAPTYRENLQLLTEPFDTIEDKLPRLVNFLNSNPGASIVYVTTQKQAETVAQALGAAGVTALHYHAGMETEKRSLVQDEFMGRNDLTIVATIAFGMGIDKPDIRNIIHYDFPRSLEGYSQEIGRAGRDGLPSKCMLYLCGVDWAQREIFCRLDLPSKKNVGNLLRNLFASNEGAEAEDVIEASANEQSQTYDIKVNSLNLLYSQLELRFELLRAITPKYSKYYFLPSDSFISLVGADEDPIAGIILEDIKKRSSKRAKVRTVDVDQLSEENGIERGELVLRIQSWSDQGLIELKPGGVIQRYRMLRPFPKDEADIQALVDKAYEQMEHREMDDLERSKKVINLTTSPGCIALGLATHFGDEGSVGEKGCGKCQFCLTGEPLVMSDPIIKRSPADPSRIKVILDACRVRDDPRLLAKVAFGIPSPRIAKEKCGGRNPIFGSMADCDFDALVEEFAKHCPPEE